MDFRKTIIPKSDQLNFEDVQTENIIARIKAVRQGDAQQPVYIDLDGFEGRPYKPSKSMRRVLIGGWGSDGLSWVGKHLELKGDRNVKFGGVAVGGIKIQGMSDIDGDFSMMLTESRGKRAEHRVTALSVEAIKLNEFIVKSSKMDVETLEKAFSWVSSKFANDKPSLEKATEYYNKRLIELKA